MKKVLIVFVALIFASCQAPILQNGDTATPHYAIVKNSLWKTTKIIKLDTVARSLSDPTYAEIVAQVAASNVLALTNQEWVYLDDAPDISDAPNGNIFYVNPLNGMVNWSYLNLTRQYIFDHYQEYIDGAHGQLVYVDHIPPPPILAKDTTPYEWYSMYVIEDAPNPDVKLYEDHAGYTSDEVWHGQWITLPSDQTMPDGTPGGGWLNVDKYYEQMYNIYNDCLIRPQDTWPGVTAVHMVTRQIYPPLPEIITDPVTINP